MTGDLPVGGDRLRGRQGFGKGGEALVFLAGFLHHAARHEILQLLVSTQAEHFLSSTGGVSGSEPLVDDVEKLLEFERAFL